ncbi:MAG: hypothetical protein JW882_06880 [Deltaproteobacteria bacterium]|nr:hypothetical protein [Deltaproteobacteria bacterium]
MVKFFNLILLILILSANAYSFDLLKENDNVSIYIKINPPEYKMKGLMISDWAEGNTTYYSYSPNIDGKSPVFVYANNNYLLGVIQGSPPNAYCLIDTDGDGILDLKSENIFLPYWIISDNSKKKTNNDNISFIMDLTYESFQSDDGPMVNPKINKSFDELLKFKDDVNLENRDLAYLLLFYQTYSQEMPSLCLKYIELLTKNYFVRFNKIHPILLLYKAETLMQLKNGEASIEVLNELRKIDPTFIPAKVYEYQFEPDPNKAKILLEKLKKDYPNHWIVKQL